MCFRQQGLKLMEMVMDTCPPFDAFLKPMLVLANMGEINVRESADKIADDFGMTDKAKLETKKW